MKEIKSNLNNAVIELLKFLEEPIIDENESKSLNKFPFKGEGGVFKFPTPITNYTNTKTDFQGHTISKIRTIDDIKIGIEEKHYGKLLDVCNRIYSVENINGFTTKEFVEEKIFDWLIDRYINNIKVEPIKYLQDEIDRNSKVYTYYFVVNNIVIEDDFKLGKCSIFCADKKFLDEEKTHINIKDDEFDKLTSFMHGTIILKVETEGVHDKAEEEAILNSKLFLNSLKVFLLDDSIVFSTGLPELNYESFGARYYKYLVRSEVDSFYDWKAGMSRVKNTNVAPTTLSKEKLGKAYDDGLRDLLYYFANADNSELSNILKYSTIAIGEAFSILNYYDRIVKLISLLESIFIRHGKGYGQTILNKDVIPRLFVKELEQEAKRINTYHYKVRDRYLHHRQEIKIDGSDFFKFQFFIQKLLLNLVAVHYESGIKTRDELLDYFNIK